MLWVDLLLIRPELHDKLHPSLANNFINLQQLCNCLTQLPVSSPHTPSRPSCKYEKLS